MCQSALTHNVALTVATYSCVSFCATLLLSTPHAVALLPNVCFRLEMNHVLFSNLLRLEKCSCDSPV